MKELQDKIDEAKKMIDTATSEERASLLKDLLSFNEEWIERDENDESVKEARKGALNSKKTKLKGVVRELTEKEEQERRESIEKEIQSIWDDMLKEDKYNIINLLTHSGKSHIELKWLAINNIFRVFLSETQNYKIDTVVIKLLYSSICGIVPIINNILVLKSWW